MWFQPFALTDGKSWWWGSMPKCKHAERSNTKGFCEEEEQINVPVSDSRDYKGVRDGRGSFHAFRIVGQSGDVADKLALRKTT